MPLAPRLPMKRIRSEVLAKKVSRSRTGMLLPT